MASYQVKQSSTAYPLLFLLVSSSDHSSPVTGASPTVKISKGGAAGESPSGAVSEIDAVNMPGWYKVAGNATDTATLGPLALHATTTGADPCDTLFEVVAFDPQASTNLGLSALPTANPTTAGGMITVGIGSGQANPSSGKIPATLASTDVTGNLPADVQTIKTQSVTCSAAVTVPALIASTTNITTIGAVSGSVGSVTAAITLPSIPVGWITASGIATSALNGKGNWLSTLGAHAPDGWIAAASFAEDIGTLGEIAESVWTTTNADHFAVVGSPGYAVKNGVPLLLTQAVPTSNTAQTVGDALNAARAQGFGKWTLAGTALTLYAADGTTIVRNFTLDNAAAPTQRS